jgi:hypothetical protein
MINTNSLEVFEYFLSCYFNQSADLDDLSILGSEFRESENKHRVKGFLNELKLLKFTESWEVVQEFIAKYGMRNLSISEVQETIDTLIQILLDAEM